MGQDEFRVGVDEVLLKANQVLSDSAFRLWVVGRAWMWANGPDRSRMPKDPRLVGRLLGWRKDRVERAQNELITFAIWRQYGDNEVADAALELQNAAAVAKSKLAQRSAKCLQRKDRGAANAKRTLHGGAANAERTPSERCTKDQRTLPYARASEFGSGSDPDPSLRDISSETEAEEHNPRPPGRSSDRSGSDQGFPIGEGDAAGERLVAEVVDVTGDHAFERGETRVKLVRLANIPKAVEAIQERLNHVRKFTDAVTAARCGVEPVRNPAALVNRVVSDLHNAYRDRAPISVMIAGLATGMGVCENQERSARNGRNATQARG